MAKLIYSAIASLDGYVTDEKGAFEWAAPDAQVLASVNEQERPVGTYLYGRRMYQVMSYWETADTAGTSSEVIDYAAIWRSADKVVFSRTLEEVSTARTRLVRDFDPGAVRQWKESAQRDISIGGPEIAALALRAGLVDECHLFLNPIVIGGGTQALPDGLRVDLDLLDEYRFDNGVVHLHYRLQ